jgi:molybdenum cofactor cytidylyltransferase
MGGVVVGLVLAAGAGTRFGEEVKQLAPFRGRPLVTWPIAALREGGVEDVVVVLGAHADAVAAAVDADTVVVEDWPDGLSASLRAGVAAAAERGAEAVMVVLGDQPLLSPAAIAKVLSARDPDTSIAIRATYDGRPGHPTLIESTMFPAITELHGDTGARDLLRGATFTICDTLGSPADADTPDALARLAAEHDTT